MARTCPACHSQIPLRGVIVRRARFFHRPWQQFARSQYFCPCCGAQVKPVMNIFGYVVLAAMLAVIAFLVDGPSYPWAWERSFVGGALFWGAIVALWVGLSVCLGKWGMTFSASESKPTEPGG